MAHDLLEGGAEGAVAAVAAFYGELTDGEIALGGYRLAIDELEVTDAQMVDVGVVGDALVRKVTA